MNFGSNNMQLALSSTAAWVLGQQCQMNACSRAATSSHNSKLAPAALACWPAAPDKCTIPMQMPAALLQTQYQQRLLQHLLLCKQWYGKHTHLEVWVVAEQLLCLVWLARQRPDLVTTLQHASGQQGSSGMASHYSTAWSHPQMRGDDYCANSCVS